MEVALENGEKIILTYDDSSYDRMKELKVFDNAKAGVKGIADSRLSKIPRIFVRPAEELAAEEKLFVVNNGSSELGESTPVIDLHKLEDRRKEIVDEVRYAAETWGFFQLLNHGIPQNVMDDMEKGFTRFHEQDIEIKKQFYTRDFSRRVKLNTNFDLFVTNAARWKDTLNCSMLAPDSINPQELPNACRDEILEYTKHVIKVGDTLMELLSEALGLKRDHLKNMDCTKFLSVIGHYYPPCPQPELTLGASKHSDPTFITVLSKGEVDGLQIFYQDRWVAIRPLPGALIINIGDLLQLISNDKFKSGIHRVMSSSTGPRVSVVSFFATNFIKSPRLYGPIKELIDENNPPVYKDVSLKDYMEHYYAKGLDGQHALNPFKA